MIFEHKVKARINIILSINEALQRNYQHRWHFFYPVKIQIHGRSNGLHNVYTIMLGGFRGHAPLDK